MKRLITLLSFFSLFILSTNYAQLTVYDQESTPNLLLQVIDEGTGGSIGFKVLSAISNPSGKLYNLGGNLYWNGSQIATSYSAGGWTDDGSVVRLSTITDKIGIGITTPDVNLHLVGNDGVIFFGQHGSGTTRNFGLGSRMIWYPKKSAFRAGRSYSEEWYDINIGNFSVAMGQETKASGLASFAMGRTAIADGDYSNSLGYETTADGNYATAMGYQTEASGDYSTGFGQSNTASGENSIAAGVNSTASALNTAAIGDNTTASGISALATGYYTIASGNYSTALGLGAHATALASVSIGEYTTAGGRSSSSLGSNTSATGDYSTAMGYTTTASGDLSTAMGNSTTANGNYTTTMGSYVKVNGEGAFFVGDHSTTTVTEKSEPNRFHARFSRGYYLYTNSAASLGSYIGPGGNSWTSISDSTKKEKFQIVNGEDVLERISKFRLGSWNYIGQDPVKFRHYGPMAQDFFAAFGHDGIGTIGCDTLLASADFDGVNLIAIQALEKRTRQQQATIVKLETKIDQLERLLDWLTSKDDENFKVGWK